MKRVYRNTEPHRWMIWAISAVAYLSGFLITARLLPYVFYEGTQDRLAVLYWSPAFATLIWGFGVAFALSRIALKRQLRWWPLSIALAGIHGALVLLAVFLLDSRTHSLQLAQFEFLGIAALAAAISCSLYLLVIWLLWPQAARPSS